MGVEKLLSKVTLTEWRSQPESPTRKAVTAVANVRQHCFQVEPCPLVLSAVGNAEITNAQ
jgi:hypothetical protein